MKVPAVIRAPIKCERERKCNFADFVIDTKKCYSTTTVSYYRGLVRRC